MKRPLKKSIAFLLFMALSLQLVFTATPNKVSAASSAPFEVYNGYISQYNGTDPNWVIPETDATGISLYYDEVLESIVIPEGIKEVSLYCITKLKKITFPSTVTSIYLCFCDELETLDLSNLTITDEAHISISECGKLKTIKAGELGSSDVQSTLYADYCPELKTIDFSDASLDSLYIQNCEKLEEIDVKETNFVYLNNLPSLKKFDIPEKTVDIALYGVKFDGITLKNNENYEIKNGGLYHTYKTEDDEVITVLEAIDVNKETINIADGTTSISFLNLSGNYYKVKTINMPDSIEELSAHAFYGGTSIKKINMSKNVITMGSYVFTGVDADITIPEKTKYVDSEAFYEYGGKLSLAKDTKYLTSYEDGIYHHYYYDNDGVETLSFTELVYYPSKKTSIKFAENVNYIGTGVFKNSSIKSLDIPEGVSYLELDLSNAKNLKSVTIPSTAEYISSPFFFNAPALKSIKVSEDNKYYASYKNCLYTKEMDTLLDVPGALTDIVIPEGVLSIPYYIIDSNWEYIPETDEYIETNKPTVTFPKSLTSIPSFNCELAKVYADTDLAEYIVASNEELEFWGREYDYEPTLINYVLRDSNKDLLNMIWVVDEMTVKKGKKETAQVSLPSGLVACSELTLGKNTECKISYSSSNKKIAKVNSKTGKITGVKKGTCTINVTCTIDNGKKTTSKKFKIKLKVK